MVGQEAANASFPTAGATFLIAGTIFVLGYRIAVARRANADYKRTKAALPDMRKTFWLAVWAAIKFGFWVFIVASLLVAWLAHDIREGVS